MAKVVEAIVEAVAYLRSDTGDNDLKPWVSYDFVGCLLHAYCFCTSNFSSELKQRAAKLARKLVASFLKSTVAEGLQAPFGLEVTRQKPWV